MPHKIADDIWPRSTDQKKEKKEQILEQDPHKLMFGTPDILVQGLLDWY